jgi:hypothetical protein
MKLTLEETSRRLAEILERSGYEYALATIQDELIPLAKKNHISIDAAIELYIVEEGGPAGGEQDTSWYQLHMALCSGISEADMVLYKALDIFSPLE